MKTINCIYEDINLKEFISEHIDSNNSNILLQIFSGVCEKKYLETLRVNILKLLPNIRIIGSTTDGEIINGDTTEHKTVLSFSHFYNTTVHTFHTPLSYDSFQTGVDLASKFSHLCDCKLMITFSDGLDINGQEYLNGIESRDNNIVITGGMAGDNSQFKNTYVLNEHGVFDSSAVCAILCSKSLHVTTQFSFDWEKIGKPLHITKSKKNRVYTIDDLPAAEIYGKYLGKEVQEALPEMGIEFPLIIQKDGISIARAVLKKHKDNSLSFAGNIEEGEIVQFGYGNVNNILTHSTTLANEVRKNPIESIFIYSCMARKRLLGSSISQEISPLNSLAPTSGFFTYGEFYHNSEYNSQLLNQSMTIVALNECSTCKATTPHIEIENKRENQTLKALSHLISVTNNELNSMTNNLEAIVQEKTLHVQEKNSKINKMLITLDRNIIISRTDLKGIITDVSQAFCVISGYTKQELIGKPHNIVRHPDMPSFAFSEMWNALKHDACWFGEIKNLKKDGSYYWVDVHAEPEYDEKGNKIGYFAIRHDITAHKEVELLSLELEETQREVVFHMGAIGESRSKETGNHVKRVAEYSYLLAKACGLGEGDALLLKQASPMHDIGKVAIADSILNKPGLLNEEERAIMNTHAKLGYDMLKHSSRPLLQAAAIVAYQHHEHYNGKGYPQGLKEGEIHVYGRITAIADVFDALGSDRCYKKAWSDEKIFALLLQERAKQFDPTIVDLFFSNIDKILKIRDKFKDEFEA